MIKVTFRKDITTERYVAVSWTYVEKVDITERSDIGDDVMIATFGTDEVPKPFYQKTTQYYLDIPEHKLKRSITPFSFRSDADIANRSVEWENVLNRPSQFPPTAHKHNASDVFDVVSQEALDAHINDKDNPHDTTPEKIHASRDDHTHTLSALGAASVDHNHNNTYSQLGHLHVPVDISAADRIHAHKLQDITDFDPSTLSGIPSGFIGIWNGDKNNIPEGFHECDGTNGTPNLQGVVVLGASEQFPVGTDGNVHNAVMIVPNDTINSN